MDLSDYREEIDRIDRKLLDLFEDRMRVSRGIAEWKAERGTDIYDPVREEDKLQQISALAEKGMSGYAREFFSRVMELSRQYQKDCMETTETVQDDEKFALLGGAVKQSYSPRIHRKFGNYIYELRAIKEEELEPILRSGEYRGFNITIPYKIKAMEICDQVSEEAGKIGCVNTIIRKRDGTLWGYNTDYFGFRYLMEKNQIDPKGKKCLVLGSGGSSLTVRAVLQDMGAGEIVVISRKGKNNYDNIGIHRDARIIVNTTPVGMYPNNGGKVVDIRKFPHLDGAVDLIYNPIRTQLVLDAMKKDIPAAGGLAMLVAQAKAASELFQAKKIDDEEIRVVKDEIQNELLNLVLIGMPGAGKSYIGRKMAESRGREFIDTDVLIAEREGRSIDEIFETDGEEYFRKLETEVLREACVRSGLVIAAGGGIVTQKRNYDIIRQNSIVIWVRRDLDQLETEGRPLLRKTTPDAMYEERKEAYESWSDFFIDNNPELD